MPFLALTSAKDLLIDPMSNANAGLVLSTQASIFVFAFEINF